MPPRRKAGLQCPAAAIYGEVVRRASLLEQLQRDYKVIVTGPTTLLFWS